MDLETKPGAILREQWPWQSNTNGCDEEAYTYLTVRARRQNPEHFGKKGVACGKLRKARGSPRKPIQ